jgi:hypothetical protein
MCTSYFLCFRSVNLEEMSIASQELNTKIFRLVYTHLNYQVAVVLEIKIS